jgi:hypothetical protein
MTKYNGNKSELHTLELLFVFLEVTVKIITLIIPSISCFCSAHFSSAKVANENLS